MFSQTLMSLNVIKISVQNDESLHGHQTNERRVRKQDKKVRGDVIKDDSRRWRERGGAAVMCDGRLVQR